MKKERAIHIRKIIVDTLAKLESQKAFATQLLAGLRNDGSVNEHEQKLIEQLVKGTVERQGSIDSLLNTKLSKGVSSLPPKVRATLRLAVYQIQHSTSVPAAIVVDESVGLLKKGKTAGLSKLVNAVLRGILRDVPKVNLEDAHGISESHDHPEWMVKRWIDQFDVKEAQALCEFNNQNWPLTVRVNTTRASRDELLESLASDAVRAQKGEYSADAVTILSLAGSPGIEHLESFKAGLFQVQDESSMLVIDVLNPQSGETVLDLCSAPGGKTTHIAQRLASVGKVVAVELHKSKLGLINENCERLQLSNVEVLCADGTNFTSGELFDRVLVDAPCSGLGVIGRKSEMRWRKSEQDFVGLNQLQGALLDNAAQLVKPGGYLVYSTCSIDPCENTEVVETFLSGHDDFQISEPEGIDSTLLDESGFLALFPHRHRVGGAFAAKLQRNL